MRISVLTLLGLALFSQTGLADTLDSVRKKGFIQCGVSQSLPGFSNADAKGGWSGIDVSYCQALAAAVLGDSSKVKYRPMSAKERFTALQSGEIDILARNTTWTLIRDASLGIDFIGVNFYDGQTFMVPKKLKIDSVKQLDGATICVSLGTTSELNLADHFRANKLKYKLVTYERYEEVHKAYEAGRCDAITSDRAGLFTDRLRLQKPDEHVILTELISKEPLGPAVRQGDQKWSDIARWTLFAMIEAEELGLRRDNFASFKATTNPSIRRFLGSEGDMGKALGLDNAWAAKIVSQVGNYGEVFERYLGSDSPIKMDRGMNNLWNKGGLIYGMPIR